MLDKGADPYFKSGKEEKSAIHIAVQLGEIDIFNKLLYKFDRWKEENCYIDKIGQTALHYAAQHVVDPSFPRRLLNAGWKFDLEDKDGFTALDILASKSKPSQQYIEDIAEMYAIAQLKSPRPFTHLSIYENAIKEMFEEKKLERRTNFSILDYRKPTTNKDPIRRLIQEAEENSPLSQQKLENTKEKGVARDHYFAATNLRLRANISDQENRFSDISAAVTFDKQDYADDIIKLQNAIINQNNEISLLCIDVPRLLLMAETVDRMVSSLIRRAIADYPLAPHRPAAGLSGSAEAIGMAVSAGAVLVDLTTSFPLASTVASIVKAVIAQQAQRDLNQSNIEISLFIGKPDNEHVERAAHTIYRTIVFALAGFLQIEKIPVGHRAQNHISQAAAAIDGTNQATSAETHDLMIAAEFAGDVISAIRNTKTTGKDQSERLQKAIKLACEKNSFDYSLLDQKSRNSIKEASELWAYSDPHSSSLTQARIIKNVSYTFNKVIHENEMLRRKVVLLENSQRQQNLVNEAILRRLELLER